MEIASNLTNKELQVWLERIQECYLDEWFKTDNLDVLLSRLYFLYDYNRYFRNFISNPDCKASGFATGFFEDLLKDDVIDNGFVDAEELEGALEDFDKYADELLKIEFVYVNRKNGYLDDLDDTNDSVGMCLSYENDNRILSYCFSVVGLLYARTENKTKDEKIIEVLKKAKAEIEGIIKG